MRKTLLLLASAALLLVGCAKEQGVSEAVNSGDLVEVSITTATTELSKAAIDQDGKAENVTRWIMEVRDAAGSVYARKNDSESAGTLQHTFTIKLVKNQKYTFAFWADNGDVYYDASDLSAVKYKDGQSVVANVDAKDAFSAVETLTFTETSNYSITLHRPFAQLNVITNDLAALRADAISADAYNAFKPKNFKATVTVPTKFNVLTGAASDETELILSASEFYGKSPKSYEDAPAKATMFMAYVFASKDDKDVRNIKFKFDVDSQTGNNSFDFSAVPFQRNYRTNILGNFLSGDATWTVDIAPAWDGEYDYPPYEAGTIAAANAALADGQTNINITTPESGTLTIPAASNGKDLIIAVDEKSDMDLKVDASESTPKSISISAGATKSLNVDAPATHVELLTGEFTTVDAITSATTLVVGKDVTIGTLNVNGGNAKIHGLVTTITKASASVVDFYVSTAEGLRNVAEKITATSQGTNFMGKVYITEDIDLNNEEWTPIDAFNKPLYIDGQGHTIKNLKVTESTVAYIGFIGSACGLTVKNLNFDTVKLSYPSTQGENARGGVIAGHVWGATVENCRVKNVDITACQKVGGLIGYIEGDTNVPHYVTGCSVENVSIKSNDSAKILQHGAGGFIGHISLAKNSLIKVSGCSVKNVTIADFGTSEYSLSELQRVPHVFIGNACNTYTGEETPSITSHSIVLENNTISGDNTVLPTCMYSSAYFGWAGNAEERPTWKGGIYIDGTPWKPGYPVKNLTNGKGYPTLSAAMKDAQNNDEIQILDNLSNIGTVSLKHGVTVDGCGKTISGASSVSFDANGGTVKNVVFKDIHNEANKNSPIYANELAGKVEISGCTFNHCDWDAIQMTPKGGAEIVIKDNIFYAVDGQKRFIHIQSDGELDMPVVITGNKLYGMDKLDMCAVELYYPADFTKVNISGNIIDGDIATVCILGKENNATVNRFDAAKNWLNDGGSQVVMNAAIGADKDVSDVMLCTTLAVAHQESENWEGNLCIMNEAGLREFSTLVNSEKTFEGKTLVLMNDIDLKSADWVPAAPSISSYPSIGFFGTFDGKNHTIKNMTCSANDPDYATAGFIGAGHCTIKDLTLENVNVSSTHYAGAFVGYASAKIDLSNCKVKGGSITSTPEWKGSEYDNGDKAGGLIGYTTDCTVSNCVVEDVTVKAYRDLGGIVGCAGNEKANNSSISNCTVKNSFVIQDNTNAYKTSIDTYGELFGRKLGDISLTNNTFENVTVKSIN